MIYDVIIIGGGAAGLFAGASLPKGKSALILEKSKTPGKKLLLSGALQCNLTHGGNIKDFLKHYGEKGKKIRSILYAFNNERVINFFEKHGVKCLTRDDGKVFPTSLKSTDILNSLLKACKENSVQIICQTPVRSIQPYYENAEAKQHFKIICDNENYESKNLIVATGGASYPATGSDGSFYKVLQDMGLDIISPAPALVPIKVHDYPYAELSGLSFENVQFSVLNKNAPRLTEDLLFTHNSFSGPAVLNSSRYIKSGDKISINYLPQLNSAEVTKKLKKLIAGHNKQIPTFLVGCFDNCLPKRFIEILCSRLQIDCTAKASSLTGVNLKALITLLTEDQFIVSGTSGFNVAMVTKGGVSLDEIDLKTLEIKKYPGLHVIGEALDIDGDTGGYNLQFAFSSGYLVAKQI